MRLLDRYLFRELLTPLAFCLGGFLIFWISYDLFTELQEMQERKLHLLDVIEYSVAMTPEFLVTILPVVLLLALLYTLTNHARHNEITAMRAAGVSLWRLCVPYLVVGLAASVVLFWLNEWCVPRSANWAERILDRHVQKPDDAETQNEFRNFGFTNARDHRTWFIAEYRVKTAAGELDVARRFEPPLVCRPRDSHQRRLDFFQRGGILADGRKRAAVAVISNKCADDAGIHRKTGGN
jgi:lipopolysaccharide export system permease protein